MIKTIKVTQERIAEAVRRSSSHCMISEAVREQLPEARFVSTDLQTIRLTLGDTRHVFLTPRRAQRALVDFDQGVTPAPFNFQLLGGQEIKAGSRFGNIRAPRKQTKTDTKYTKRRRLRAHLRASAKPTLAPLRKGHEHKISVILGGKEPPRIPSGARRQFGLRGLER